MPSSPLPSPLLHHAHGSKLLSARRPLELQRVYFALLPNTQSLGVIVHVCNVTLGGHASHHADGMSFQLLSPQGGGGDYGPCGKMAHTKSKSSSHLGAILSEHVRVCACPGEKGVCVGVLTHPSSPSPLSRPPQSRALVRFGVFAVMDMCPNARTDTNTHNSQKSDCVLGHRWKIQKKAVVQL